MTSISCTPSAWLEPLSEQAPCGPSLEYDPEFAMLVARLRPRGEAQYGQFIDSSDATDWPDIERLCRELLRRSRDINLLVWLCRARVRAAHSRGLAQGLGMLADLLERWPQQIHPQPWIDGEHDLAVRANALAALCDPEGLLGEIRDLAVSRNAMRLLVRDVERAGAAMRGDEAAAQAQALREQLHALRERASTDADAPIAHLANAALAARRIQRWCEEHLKEHAPAMQSLTKLLAPFEIAPAPLPLETRVTADKPTVQADALPGNGPRDRADAQRSIRQIRQWFEVHEPSSPVTVLLKQAERLVGRRFALLADAIPLDLLRKWDAEGDESSAGT